MSQLGPRDATTSIVGKEGVTKAYGCVCSVSVGE